MLGRLATRRFTCGCCDDSCSKKTQRVREERQWRKEMT
jgi:hypothetical protein